MAEQEQAAAAATATTEAKAEDSILDKVLKATPAEKPRAEALIRTLVDQLMEKQVKWDKSVGNTIAKRIREIDAIISKQLAEVMHAPEFQKLEGSWRGLSHLVFKSVGAADLKFKVLNSSKRDLLKDFETASEFTESQTWKHIYTGEFDQAGGEPYGAMIGDYEFSGHPDDISLLKNMSQVAAAGFCPFISAAGSDMFGFKDFSTLNQPRDIKKIFDSVEYAGWKSFRDTEESRFVTLTMPRVLARLPYGKGTKPIDEFDFEEVALIDEGKNKGKGKVIAHNEYCWMNSAYAMGERMATAFAYYGWCTAIRGAEGGGKVEGLPNHVVISKEGDMEQKCPAEALIPDSREKEFSDLGFLPLVHYKNKDYAVFLSGQTAQKPKKYDNAAGTANAAISARLPYIMATSRISHFLKCAARDWIGSFMEANECQDRLNRFLTNYVLKDDKPSQEMKAKYPLAEAKVEVKEIPGSPGAYNAIAWLRPWLQMEELNASVRMVARIPTLAK